MAGEAVVFEVGVDVTSFDRAMADLKATVSKVAASTDKSLSDSFDKAAATASHAGNAISIGVTAPLVAIGTLAGNTAVKFTKLYETTMIVFESMLGGQEAASALYSSLLDIAKGSTYAQETFLECGKKLVGMGVDADTTKSILQATTDAVAGFGGTSENIKAVTDAFAKMSNSGRLSMEEVNTLSDNGVQALKILANQYGVSTDEMRAMISEGAVPAKDAIRKLTDGIEDGTDGAAGMTEAMGGMAASLKAGTLTGAFDGINTAVRSFSLALVGINPTLKETDEGYAESEERIRQLTAAVVEISEIIPLLAKVFSGVTDAIGRVLDALVGTNVKLDESTHKWKDVGGALDDFKRYLRDTPTEQLAMIGNLLVAIAVTGPALKVVSVAMEGLNVVIAAGKAIYSAAEIAYIAYKIAVMDGSKAAAVATAATEALNLAMKANPAVFVASAVIALVAAIGALAVASSASAESNEHLTVASQEQKEKVEELQAEYDRVCESQGAHSDAALAAKAALDEETAAFDGSKQTVSELEAELEDSSAAHKQLMEDLDKAGQAAEDEAGEILALVGQFDALARKENRSEGDKLRLKAVTDQLNASVEGLNLSYDESNDSLSMTADAVDQVCRAEANRIRYQQKMEEIPKLLVEEAEKSETLQKAKDDLAAAQSRLADASEKSTAGFRDNAKTTSEANAEMRKHTGTTGDARREVQRLTEAVDTQTSELEELRSRINTAEEDAARFATNETALAAAVSAVAAGMGEQAAAALYGVDAGELAAEISHREAMAQEELTQKLNETEQAVVDYAAAHPGFQAALEASGHTASSFAETLAAQGRTMDDAAGKIEEYRDRITSAFDEIAWKQEESIDRAAEIYLKNLDATRNWSANLSYLANESGLSFNEGFITAVQDGGVEKWGQVIDQLAAVARDGGTIMINDVNYTAQEFVDLYAAAPEAAREQMLAEIGFFGEIGAAADQALADGARENLEVVEAANDAMADAAKVDPEETDNTEAGASAASTLAEGMNSSTGVIYDANGNVTTAGTINPGDVDSSAAGAANVKSFTDAENASIGVIYDANGNITTEGTINPGDVDSSPGGASNAESFAEGQDDAADTVAASSDEISKLAADHMSSASADARQAGASMAGEHFADGVGSGRDSASAEARSLSKLVADHMSSASGDAWWAGYNMVAGMAEGISAGRSVAVNAAADAASAAVSAAKAALDEHSPSRVMREVGKYFSEGYAVGIDDRAGKAVDAARDAAERSIEAARRGSPALSFGLDAAALDAFQRKRELAVALAAPTPPPGSSGDAQAIMRELGLVRESIDGFRKGIGRTIRECAPTKVDAYVENPREIARAMDGR